MTDTLSIDVCPKCKTTQDSPLLVLDRLYCNACGYMLRSVVAGANYWREFGEDVKHDLDAWLQHTALPSLTNLRPAEQSFAKFLARVEARTDLTLADYEEFRGVVATWGKALYRDSIYEVMFLTNNSLFVALRTGADEVELHRLARLADMSAEPTPPTIVDASALADWRKDWADGKVPHTRWEWNAEFAQHQLIEAKA